MVFWKLKYAYCRSDSVEENFEGDSQKLRQVRVYRIVKLFRKVKYTYWGSGHVRKSLEGNSQKLRQVTKWCFEG